MDQVRASRLRQLAAHARQTGPLLRFLRGNYRTRFTDGWRPRLLFVTQSEARRSSIAELLEKEDFPTSGEFAARALTLQGARQYLSRNLSASASSPAREVPMPQRQQADPPEPRVRPVDCLDAVRPRRPPPSRPGYEGGPALCAAEERLRRGWVSVRGDLLICLEHEMKGVFGTLQKALEMLRRLRAKPDEMPRLAPEAVHMLDTFSLYARRAQSELAHYGLKRGDGPPYELT